MARFSQHGRKNIDATVDFWRERSLVADLSFTHPDAHPACWSVENVTDLYHRFLDNPLTGTDAGGTFATKWQRQLEGASTDVRLLAGELLLVYYLVTRTVGQHRKLTMVNDTINDPDLLLDSSSTEPPVLALSEGIANPGIHYNTRQDIQVGYLIDLVLRLKRLTQDERRLLLTDNPWKFGEFADDPSPGISLAAMRHVVCHLLYPAHFERIASGTHKRQVLDVFGSLVADKDETSLDQRLYQVRTVLEEKLPGTDERRRDYYNEPLEPIWRPAKETGTQLSPITALKHKKQIVFYGSPGTGKTYRASQVAEAVIRGAALERWGLDGYFADPDRVDAAVAENIVRLQLHPGIGYPEFVVGLQLDENGRTVHTLGTLPKLVMKMAQDTDAMPALPRVLILDEINRTDLSAMFGEGFSAIETDKRGTEIQLPGVDANGLPLTLTVPEDLYIIGTMNEIDHSVESLDFALRRRFFWFPAGFDIDGLYEIWRKGWADAKPRVSYELAREELDRLAENILELNSVIAASAELGPAYELGQAFFADLPFFVATTWPTRRPNGGRILWDGQGTALQPLTALWIYCVKPLLEQYLAASDEQGQELNRLKDAFLDRG